MDFSLLHRTIQTTAFVDTHEHLLEERTRLRGDGGHAEVPCTDAALLFWHYARNDLEVAGMPQEERDRFFAPGVDPEEKWRLLTPYWTPCRATGYLQAVRWTMRVLFEEPIVDAASFVRVSARMREHARPGFYRDVLRVAGVESCQVNSFEAIFCESTLPDVLLQDLSIQALSINTDLEALGAATGIHATTLVEMHAIIDWHFDQFGARAVAVKTGAAYARRLDFTDVGAETAAPLFARFARGQELSPMEARTLEDHLTRYCISRASQHGLPIKVHCGYHAGVNYMPLAWVRQNAADLCPLFSASPQATFVLMHIGYPYQDEYIALAKHYSNVYIDLCWAWIINPQATMRFVREFLLAAPASKLLPFGGDYSSIEPIVGHAQIARHGLEQTLQGLVETGWLTLSEAVELIEPLMRGNARRVFRLDEKEYSNGQQPLSVKGAQ